MSTNTALDQIKNRVEVNRHLGKTASQDEARGTLKLIAALEAVQAFHQPRTVRAWDRSVMQICETCSDDDGGWEHYPCQTITAIEEALR